MDFQEKEEMLFQSKNTAHTMYMQIKWYAEMFCQFSPMHLSVRLLTMLLSCIAKRGGGNTLREADIPLK